MDQKPFKESFKVFARVRPFLPRELMTGCSFPIVECQEETGSLKVFEFVASELSSEAQIRKLLENPKYYQVHNFAFDGVLKEGQTQEQTFELTARGLVDSFLKGFNCSLFAYGQTGTGKTFTIEGTDSSPGLILQVLKDALNRLEELKKTNDARLTLSYAQIYNEVISDLFGKGTNLNIRKGKSGPYVEDLTEIDLSDPAEAIEALRRGASRRISAVTLQNAMSSRSHAVFTLTLEQSTKTTTCVSRLFIVDLAGSERITMAGVKGVRLEECKRINSSLSELSNVILSLGKRKEETGFVPFRNSKLTRLLETALGGNSLTTFIATVSPCHNSFSETLSTLRFASRAKSIKVTVSVNHKNSGEDHLRILERYKKDIRLLRQEGSDDFQNRSLNTFSDNEDVSKIRSSSTEFGVPGSKNGSNDEEKIDIYKDMLMNQRDVLLQLSGKLNQKNMEILSLKKRLVDSQKYKTVLKTVQNKIDIVISTLTKQTHDVDLQNVAQLLLDLQETCIEELEEN